MNECINNLQKSTLNKLVAEQKEELKGKWFLFLRNEKSLSSSAADDLKKKRRFELKDQGTASLMKEYLRNIYKLVDSYDLARTAFLLWSEKAEGAGLHCLEQMAKTIRRRIDGLLDYWKHAKLTRTSQEGFKKISSD